MSTGRRGIVVGVAHVRDAQRLRHATAARSGRWKRRTEQMWLRSTRSSSTAMRRYRFSLAEVVMIDMPSCMGVVQAGNRRSVPASSTMHTRHAPTALRPLR